VGREGESDGTEGSFPEVGGWGGKSLMVPRSFLEGEVGCDKPTVEDWQSSLTETFIRKTAPPPGHWSARGVSLYLCHKVPWQLRCRT